MTPTYNWTRAVVVVVAVVAKVIVLLVVAVVSVLVLMIVMIVVVVEVAVEVVAVVVVSISIGFLRARPCSKKILHIRYSNSGLCINYVSSITNDPTNIFEYTM